jgi:hypothetical protein
MSTKKTRAHEEKAAQREIMERPARDDVHEEREINQQRSDVISKVPGERFGSTESRVAPSRGSFRPHRDGSIGSDVPNIGDGRHRRFAELGRHRHRSSRASSSPFHQLVATPIPKIIVLLGASP